MGRVEGMEGRVEGMKGREERKDLLPIKVNFVLQNSCPE